MDATLLGDLATWVASFVAAFSLAIALVSSSRAKNANKLAASANKIAKRANKTALKIATRSEELMLDLPDVSWLLALDDRGYAILQNDGTTAANQVRIDFTVGRLSDSPPMALMFARSDGNFQPASLVNSLRLRAECDRVDAGERVGIALPSHPLYDTAGCQGEIWRTQARILWRSENGSPASTLIPLTELAVTMSGDEYPIRNNIPFGSVVRPLRTVQEMSAEASRLIEDLSETSAPKSL